MRLEDGLPPHAFAPWACHEGLCRRCELEQARAEERQ